MRDPGGAVGDIGAMEEAAIGEEDAEAVIALDDETVVPLRLGLPMRQHEQAAFEEPYPIMIRHEIGRAAQSPEFTGFQVADAPNNPPAAGEERAYWGQKAGSIICLKVQGQTAWKVGSGKSVSPAASRRA